MRNTNQLNIIIVVLQTLQDHNVLQHVRAAVDGLMSIVVFGLLLLACDDFL